MVKRREGAQWLRAWQLASTTSCDAATPILDSTTCSGEVAGAIIDYAIMVLMVAVVAVNGSVHSIFIWIVEMMNDVNNHG